MQTYGNSEVAYGWWAGNSRLANSSGLFISAHAGHAGLISVWAGGFTLFELGRYTTQSPMWDQGLVLHGIYSARCWLSNTTYVFAFYFLQGHLWHALRGLGFDFKEVDKFLTSLTDDAPATPAKPKASKNAMAPVPAAAPPVQAAAKE